LVLELVEIADVDETEDETEDLGVGVNAYNPPRSFPVVSVPSWP
ncbi:hypothetical protein Tco_1070841, partial [Tanacetum coccineum]